MKKRIIIASVLKPVDDTRMFEKFGLSLSQTNKYDVNIIGFSSKNIFFSPEIQFHPLFQFKRLSFKRVGAPYKFFRKLLKLKPEVLIVNTVEILHVAVLYKILFGGKLLYDVQENYARNIRYTNNFPPVLRFILAFFTRGIEWLTRPWVDHYFLAEKLYEQEFSFSKGKSSIIENKYKPLYALKPVKKQEKAGKTTLLYSGTIAENYGIFHAIQFTKIISKLSPSVELLIIGYCARDHLLREVKAAIADCTNISLIGGDTLVPHQDIVKAIREADFGLLPYQPDKSIENCFPTKIYEYMAHQLPLLMQAHKPWSSFIHRHNAGVTFDYNNYDPRIILQHLRQQKFYPKGTLNEVFWESQELTFIKVINDM